MVYLATPLESQEERIESQFSLSWTYSMGMNLRRRELKRVIFAVTFGEPRD